MSIGDHICEKNGRNHQEFRSGGQYEQTAHVDGGSSFMQNTNRPTCPKNSMLGKHIRSLRMHWMQFRKLYKNPKIQKFGHFCMHPNDCPQYAKRNTAYRNFSETPRWFSMAANVIAPRPPGQFPARLLWFRVASVSNTDARRFNFKVVTSGCRSLLRSARNSVILLQS